MTIIIGSRKRVPSVIRTTACPIVTSDTEMRPNYSNVSFVRVCVAVDSLLRRSLVVALDTDLKDPYSLDRAEVMDYLRDVVKQSDESDRSEVKQHEPSYKKVS